jgi:hypothetical protein
MSSMECLLPAVFEMLPLTDHLQVTLPLRAQQYKDQVERRLPISNEASKLCPPLQWLKSAALDRLELSTRGFQPSASFELLGCVAITACGIDSINALSTLLTDSGVVKT